MKKMSRGQILFGASFGTVGAAVGWFFGGLDGLIISLVVFTAIDYITGFTSAAVNHELDSSIGAKGIARKVFQFLLVGIAHVLDAQILKQGEILRDAVIFFYIANEGLSILENMGEIGVLLPPFLKRFLKQVRDKDKDKFKKEKDDGKKEK